MLDYTCIHRSSLSVGYSNEEKFKDSFKSVIYISSICYQHLFLNLKFNVYVISNLNAFASLMFKVNAKSCFVDKMHLFLMPDFREFIFIYKNHESKTLVQYVRRIMMQRN